MLQVFAQKPSVRLIDVTTKFGYDDQSHFIHQFKRYYGKDQAKFIATVDRFLQFIVMK
ncbi:AraC family transcriptional regulator [Seinonella peptonophila]|uniref:AraC family transcriptional regulator n=1 Tax=Seinonella peptonophila TaxID=112248 RepID=UPI001114775A|nr:AraC family transcriptional regulator [Seinonella peptonophila]